MSWLILFGYIVGFFLCWGISFRMTYYSETWAINENSTPGEVIESILMCGFISLIIAFFWPIVALIFLMWRWFVKPRQNRA